MFGLQDAITLDKSVMSECRKIIDKVSLIIDYSGINRDKTIGINKTGITDYDDSDLFDCQIKGEYDDDEEENEDNIDFPNNKLNKLEKLYKYKHQFDTSQIYKDYLDATEKFGEFGWSSSADATGDGSRYRGLGITWNPNKIPFAVMSLLLSEKILPLINIFTYISFSKKSFTISIIFIP